MASLSRVCVQSGTARRSCAARASAAASTDAGKVAIVTGANTGMGRVTAKEVGAQGFHTILACRDAGKGAEAVAALRRGNPSGSFEFRALDLADLSSVSDFCKATLDEGRPIDLLVNNAGVMACPEMATKDGFEYQLGVNHLGHFAMTGQLYPLLSDSSRKTRIVNVSSAAHMFGSINLENPTLKGEYQEWKAYGQSKLANVMFTFELAKRLPAEANIDTNTLHPGVVNTELARYLLPKNTPDFLKALLTPLQKVAELALKTPEQGASTQIYLALSPEVEGVSSKYYIDSQPSGTINKEAFDSELRSKFFDLSEELTGVSFKF